MNYDPYLQERFDKGWIMVADICERVVGDAYDFQLQPWVVAEKADGRWDGYIWIERKVRQVAK